MASHSFRITLAAAALAIVGAGGGLAAPAEAVPVIGPNVQPRMFTDKLGTGCTYNVSVLVNDQQAPVQIVIVDDRGRVVKRLKTSREERNDTKRVVEGWWVVERTGVMRVVAIQNGVKRKTKPLVVTQGFNTGSACFGV